jgi:hypothetical protein
LLPLSFVCSSDPVDALACRVHSDVQKQKGRSPRHTWRASDSGIAVSPSLDLSAMTALPTSLYSSVMPSSLQRTKFRFINGLKEIKPGSRLHKNKAFAYGRRKLRLYCAMQ